ncbi:MAG: tRNA (N(6)-L-threonylcarbamoyladenosine(37)-C(2))-methylthiotransferase MtaB [Ruminococcaceae bacterium]|nr:tRNA (N(6)-L-threonylcarbamoyladenosine(37)-C(2))-methylthiotransferase MtaB [Oscillospiraceae bacterium]
MIERTIALYTLGCKVNQYETEAVLESFLQNGFSCVDFSEYADVYVVNTCTVTGLGDRKSRQIIRRAKAVNPDSVLVVMGCYAQTAQDDILKIPEVDIVLGTSGRNKIYDIVKDFIKNRERKNLVGDIFKQKEFEELEISDFDNKTRAFLKVQDGCNRYCSYCIIPYARGNIRSRSLENSVKEARKLVEAGFCELVLVGIHLASYGRETKDLGLTDLINALSEIEGLKRIRLGSLEPTIFTEDFIKTIAINKKVCHHFHISLQSGCDETLKRMNRKYNTAEYLEAVKNIRKEMPDSAVTTDIMTGFPGETEEEFGKTCEFIKKVKFSDAHIFKYSVRKGTKAAQMANQVSPHIKEERSKRLVSLIERSRNEFNESFLGEETLVLFERAYNKEKNLFEGKTSNYITVVAKADALCEGKILKVKIEKAQDDILFGEII